MDSAPKNKVKITVKAFCLSRIFAKIALMVQLKSQYIPNF